MDNHPIPQDVTGFKFRIIGSITVKQFLYLLGSGIAAAILIFLIPLNLFVKIPLVVIFGGIGPFFAFIPIEGRPADLMLGNFFKAVFANSIYLYEKQGANLALFPAFSFATPQKKASQTAQGSKTDVKRALLARTLRSSAYAPDNEEIERIHKINESFSGGAAGVNLGAASIARPTAQAQQNAETAGARRAPSLVVESAPQQGVTSNNLRTISNEQKAAGNNQKSENSNQKAGSNKQETRSKKQEAVNNSNQKPTVIEQKSENSNQTPIIKKQEAINNGQESMKEGKNNQKGAYDFFDSLPDRPNVILGVVQDARGKFLPNIIVEVEDTKGTPVRTFKTDVRGKFSAATALPNGEYNIKFEDPRKLHKFATIKVSLSGQIFEPVLTRSVDAREELRRNLFESKKG